MLLSAPCKLGAVFPRRLDHARQGGARLSRSCGQANEAKCLKKHLARRSWCALFRESLVGSMRE
jgi:hypothetical protein